MSGAPPGAPGASPEPPAPPPAPLGRVAAVRLLPPAVAALTLGLAPFAPEPHLVGKLRWVLGGAVGMRALDWGDLLFHGAPWAWLAWAGVSLLRGK